MAKRIGVLTGGGDAPGQNVCLKAIVYNAMDRGYDVVGIRKGWEGLLHYNLSDTTSQADNMIILTKPRVRDIDRMGGSFLHSSRLDPSQVSPEAVPAFLKVEGQGDRPVDLTDHLKRVVDKLQLAALIVLGDRAVLSYAARLSKEGVPLIGIPKTVHNTVNGSDYSLGFSTALARGVHFVHEVRAMAGSREEIAVIEILGRETGLTTMLISLLAGADRTLVPEVTFDPERLAALLVNDQRMNPSNYAILTMSEASNIQPDKVSKYGPELSRMTNSRLLAQALATRGREAAGQELYQITADRQVGLGVSGSGPAVTEILENLTGQRLLFQPLSYLIRTGDPDGQDLLGAMNFATMAVDLLAAGKTGRLVAYRQRENYVEAPIDVVTGAAGNINVADYYDAGSYSPKPGILWAARV
jgi:ATP-dependent phosphofructokinase / diphosphate-dependent phosphofructokinase